MIRAVELDFKKLFFENQKAQKFYLFIFILICNLINKPHISIYDLQLQCCS